jgi:sugar lactone lactonase YvrE
VRGTILFSGCLSLLLILQSMATGQTREKKNIPPATAQEIDELDRILAKHPNEPAALFNLALDYASIGEGGKAIELLERMADAHTGMDPKEPAGRQFKSIAGDPRFLALVARIEKENPPVVRSTTAFVLHERDLAPEGIAYDPVDAKFYVSSISKRKIVCITRDGSVTDFKTSRQDGLGETLGMKVDSRRRYLWVVSDSFAPPGSPTSDSSAQGTNAGRSGVFQYDLKTGALRFKHLLPAGSAGFLNDVAVTSTGVAFVTNTGTGEVFRISPDQDRPQLFLPAHAVPQANGIAVSGDDKVLFVAGWIGVARVDLATRQVKLLSKPRNVADAGLDGLYFYKGTLVGIQNPDLHPGRVMRYVLNPAMDTIERAEVLEAYNPGFEVPTTGTLVDGALYFMANPQVDKLKGEGTGSMPPPNELQDIRLVRLNL